jgi:hypothetical protein
MSRFRGLDGLKQELGLLPAKKTTEGCFQDCSARHYPLKTLNEQLNIVLGRPFETIRSFKALRPPKRGWPWDHSSCSSLNPSQANSRSWAWEAPKSTWGWFSFKAIRAGP